MEEIRRLAGLVMTIMVAVVIIVTISAIFPPNKTVDLADIPNMTLVSTSNIKAVNDKTNIDGRISGGMYYISGKIESIDIYKLFIEREGYLETVTIPAKVTRLVGITEGTPRLETYTEERAQFLGIGKFKVTGYILYVPEDSIVSDFTLDLEG